MPNKKAVKKKKQQMIEKSKDRKQIMDMKQSGAKAKNSPKVGKRSKRDEYTQEKQIISVFEQVAIDN